MTWDREWTKVIFSGEKFHLDKPDGFKFYWQDLQKEERTLLQQKDAKWKISNGLGRLWIKGGEPLKKKKRVDPAILRKREERKRKKIEKGIRRLEKTAKKLKPLDECEIPKNIVMELDKRTRKVEKLTEKEEQERANIMKEWHKYKKEQFENELNMLDRIMMAQENALLELKNESEDLYQAALQLDTQFIPFMVKGPTATPPNANYEPPNGVYVDTTKRYDKRILPPLKLKSVKRK
ncbi:39S ribosomal protein L40, mitochondrial-like [Centruroides sculpturatus]|uniref:39S ribosomal protein L40, mitochondrial-like n=1 Tax=Centruroides sculpturatus TaxID=218467 RepID=UPI000C6E64D8|nr:39S ribosomal protein L40, mitochondrial-like [Centruroides sculpturatus]